MLEDKYFVEIWLRGYAKRFSRSMRMKVHQEIPQNIEKKLYPHITLIPPFSCEDESHFLDRFEEQCHNVGLLPFSLIGFDSFSKDDEKSDKNYLHLKAKVDPRIDTFRHRLHSSLLDTISCVAPINKLGDHIHHVTIAESESESFSSFPSWFNTTYTPIEQYMLRATVLKNKKVLCEYDFVQGKMLSRKECLSKPVWYSTMNMFSQQTDLKPTNYGFVRID